MGNLHRNYPGIFWICILNIRLGQSLARDEKDRKQSALIARCEEVAA
jgi:hypothetical protein